MNDLPERRKVGIDARVSMDGSAYEVKPDMAGETVLFVRVVRQRAVRRVRKSPGRPLPPLSGPIPLIGKLAIAPPSSCSTMRSTYWPPSCVLLRESKV
jgi:hypothetical protein